MIEVEAVDAIARLGPDWDALFDQPTAAGLQSRRAWFAASEAAALPPGAVPHYVALRDAGRPAALLPMRRDGRDGRAGITSLTTPYTVAFQPLLDPAADPAAIGAALGRHLHRWPLARLEALDPAWPSLEPLLAGLRRARLVPIRYDHFGNWSENVAGLHWPAYLARRPGALRETIRRRGAAAARDQSVRFEIVRTRDGLESALAAYEAVYATSWKQPEPFPRFNATLLPRVADLGLLRLGVLWRGETPLAAQYWVVADGTATVLKLAHDEAGRALSPGTLLTAHMIRAILPEGVTSLDFGRGDDPYKQSWTTHRRQRVGLLLANPLHPTGLAELLRHQAGRLRRTLPKSLFGRVEPGTHPKG